MRAHLLSAPLLLVLLMLPFAPVAAQYCEECRKLENEMRNFDSVAAPTPAASPALALDSAQQQPRPVVKAVMFWMDSCPHCHEVLDRVLPPLQQQYGEQLVIHLIEASAPANTERFYQAAAAFGISHDQAGVPLLIIGDQALMGTDEIAAELPRLIEQHLAAGGVGFPAVAGLADVAPTGQPAAAVCAPSTPCPEDPAPAVAGQTATPAHSTSNGFALAIAILVGMALALVYTFIVLLRGVDVAAPSSPATWPSRVIPFLALAGLGVAAYLAYVETQAVQAVCGPVGDCNAVQSSPYARLFGVLPIGVLGAIGYLAILAAWGWGSLRAGAQSVYAPLAVFGLALFGVLFSLYLTYLEPFVIRAVCAWCLTSAVIITLLMLAGLRPALVALSGQQQRQGATRSLDGEA
jgi:uncharacterized membrane protein